MLSIATAHLNSRIRNQGLSSRELWTQRDQFTLKQLPIDDRRVIQTQHENRLSNHQHSMKSKGGKPRIDQDINIGDLVYLYNDKSKTQTRNRYLVSAIDNNWCSIRKFVGNQLRNKVYKVKKNECFIVPCNEESSQYKCYNNDSSDEEIYDETIKPFTNNYPQATYTPTVTPETLSYHENYCPVEDNPMINDHTVQNDNVNMNNLAENSTESPFHSTRPKRLCGPPVRLRDYECSYSNGSVSKDEKKEEKATTPLSLLD